MKQHQMTTCWAIAANALIALAACTGSASFDESGGRLDGGNLDVAIDAASEFDTRDADGDRMTDSANGGEVGPSDADDAGDAGGIDSGRDADGGDEADPDPRGLCFVESAADTVEVSSSAELALAVANAPAGRHILIAPGTYEAATIELAAAGTEAAPVVVRPRDGVGTVTFHNADWTVTGTRLVLSGLHFKAASIDLYGSFHRVTRCQFREINGSAIALHAVTDVRVDHCDFSDYTSSDSDKHAISVKSREIVNGTLHGLLFDYNYIHDINPALAGNGTEPIGFGWAIGADHFPDFVVDHCLLENISLPGEGEIIAAKTSGVVVSYSTFVDLSGLYMNAPRAGNAWEVRSSWFERVGGSAALNVWGTGDLIIGNRFVGDTKMRVGAGDDSYAPSVDGRIIGNVMDTGAIMVGSFWGGRTATMPAKDNVLEANTGTVSLHFETGTTQSATTTAPYTPAVKLTPADVGLQGPDPLCD